MKEKTDSPKPMEAFDKITKIIEQYDGDDFGLIDELSSIISPFYKEKK